MTKPFTFSHAITRLPSASIIDGLRAVDTGIPNLATFRSHHTNYVAALKSTGATVIELPADEGFPDSTFIEDAALCLPRGAILMRPGAPSRLGEAALMGPPLRELYDNVAEITGPGFIEAGDILTTETEILIGTSARTDPAGVAELRAITAPWGYKVREVQTPPDVLHFKTDCALLDERTILTTKRLAASGCFEGYNLIYTADGEEAAANSIRFNNLVIVPAGFDQTSQRLRDAGYYVRPIGNSEAAKLDGGMSCLSLRFTPNS